MKKYIESRVGIKIIGLPLIVTIYTGVSFYIMYAKFTPVYIVKTVNILKSFFRQLLILIKKFDQCLCNNMPFIKNKLENYKNKLKSEKLIADCQIFYKKIDSWFPNFTLFIRDLFFLLEKNSSFILKSSRFYIYFCVIVYILTFFFSFFLILTHNTFCFKIASWLLYFYHIWTYPIRKIRFIFGFFFLGPFKIFGLSLQLCYSIFEVFTVNNNKINECMDKDSSNYPKSRTDYELNCMQNKAKKSWTYYNLFNDMRKVGHGLSEAMNNSDEPKIEKFYSKFNKFNLKMKETDDNYPCPKPHEWESWYRGNNGK